MLPPNGPPCPNCRSVCVWHPQLNQWGCNNCRQMLAQAPVRKQGPSCPNCAGPVTFHPPSQWGCDRCQMIVTPRMPAGSTGMSASTIILIVVVTLIVIALNVAIASAH